MATKPEPTPPDDDPEKTVVSFGPPPDCVPPPPGIDPTPTPTAGPPEEMPDFGGANTSTGAGGPGGAEGPTPKTRRTGRYEGADPPGGG